MNAGMLVGLVLPSKAKILLTIPFAVLLWVFPIASRSVFAVPFTNLDLPILSASVNFIAAYLIGCILIANQSDKKMLVLSLLVIVALYVAIPKVSFFSIGDLGSMTYTYCNCYGFEWTSDGCCHSSVNYCIGPCKRDEQTYRWPAGG